jgi:predicted NAD-dependent protein-ADP-ribosyltransferase YbiA (DUF1768 family)
LRRAFAALSPKTILRLLLEPISSLAPDHTSWWQAAKFNKEEGKGVRKRIQDAEEPQAAMEIAGRSAQDLFLRPGFRTGETNLEIMFHITLAKFRQHPKLRGWLLDTDPAALDHPIFHMRDQDDFFGLGSLQVDGKYHGRNWNGRILVLVRRILRDERAADTSSRASTLGDSASRFPSEPFPPLSDGNDEQQALDMNRRYDHLTTSMQHFYPQASLPEGALIAQRYRVLDVIKTGALTSHDSESSASFEGKHAIILEEGNDWVNL